MTNLTIRWQIERPDGTMLQARIQIDAAHVVTMYPGPPPADPMNYGADMDYRRRVEKADLLARMLGSQISADIMDACNPERKPR
jgi:hypothetical protein